MSNAGIAGDTVFIITADHGEVWGYQSQRMVRTQRWRYVFNPLDRDKLYDPSPGSLGDGEPHRRSLLRQRPTGDEGPTNGMEPRDG